MGWLPTILIEAISDLLLLGSMHSRWVHWVVGVVWLGVLTLIGWELWRCCLSG